MAVKKSELYSLLWEACNKLRGGVEPSRYKDYVLVLLFLKPYLHSVGRNLQTRC
jgi:type I restriction enzyme M protein